MTPQQISDAVSAHGDMLYRLCFVMLGSSADAEDAVQDTFMQLIRSEPDFSGDEHEKAWLIRVAVNKCRDMLRRRKWFTQLDESLIAELVQDKEECGILSALMELPEKFRTVLTLHYIEGYKVDEIAGMIGKSASAVKMRLSKGRGLLEEKYRKEYM